MARFSKKHYILIAELLAQYGQAPSVNAIAHQLIVARFADLFAADNGAFNREQFEQAASGLQKKERKHNP